MLMNDVFYVFLLFSRSPRSTSYPPSGNTDFIPQVGSKIKYSYRGVKILTDFVGVLISSGVISRVNFPQVNQRFELLLQDIKWLPAISLSYDEGDRQSCNTAFDKF